MEAYQSAQPEIAIGAATVEDAPRFPYRGMHLDVARNFQGKDAVMKLLDVMAFYKLNKFHFHLTDDEGFRIEIDGLPELTEVGVPLRDLPEEEVAVRAHAGGGVRAQLEPLRPRLDDLHEGVLRDCPLLRAEASPGGIDLVERVGDVLASLRLLAHATHRT